MAVALLRFILAVRGILRAEHVCWSRCGELSPMPGRAGKGGEGHARELALRLLVRLFNHCVFYQYTMLYPEILCRPWAKTDALLGGSVVCQSVSLSVCQ